MSIPFKLIVHCAFAVFMPKSNSITIFDCLEIYNLLLCYYWGLFYGLDKYLFNFIYSRVFSPLKQLYMWFIGMDHVLWYVFILLKFLIIYVLFNKLSLIIIKVKQSIIMLFAYEHFEGLVQNNCNWLHVCRIR